LDAHLIPWFFLVGHDDDIASLAGLLRFDWLLPGYPPNDTPPGGQWYSNSEGKTRSSLLRSSLLRLPDFGPDAPNDSSELERSTGRGSDLHPGCSSSTPGYDCKLSVFEKLVWRAINLRFVTM
jgi:4-phytase / acid phosphatase